MALSYQYKTFVPASEVTPSLAIKPFHLLNHLQDAADEAVARGGLPDVRTFGCSWMVHQYSIYLEHPLIRDLQFTIDTGAIAADDLFSDRRFILSDENGEFGLADSAWILVDLKSRRPLRLSHKLQGTTFYSKAVKPPFQPRLKKPLPPEREDIQKQLDVRMGDIDSNGHVNNAYYLSWASETVPQDVFMNCALTEAHILYKREAKYGMMLTVTTQQDELSFRHRVVNQDGTELAVLNTCWEKIGH